MFYNSTKTAINLEKKPFASGGEGEVFRVINNPDICAKIYHSDQLSKARENKISFLIENTSPNDSPERTTICYPLDKLFNARGKFVGFLMPMAFPNSIQLYELVTTQISNKLDSIWKKKYDRSTIIGVQNRLKLCVNIGIAIHTIHQSGKFILVDFKPQNILITNDGRVSITDIDSVQIAELGRVLHHGKVATPEYIPKEGEKLNPAINFIPETWDRFSLAVVFYELLFGIHPYTATSGGQYDNVTTIDEKIRKNLFVHGSKKNYLRVIPPIHNNFDLLPISLKQLFFRAFEEGNQMPDKRPSAEEWGQTIVEELAKKNFQTPPPNPFPKTTPPQTTSPLKKDKAPDYYTTPKTTPPQDYTALVVLLILIVTIVFVILKYDKSPNSQDSSSIPTMNILDSTKVDSAAVPQIEVLVDSAAMAPAADSSATDTTAVAIENPSEVSEDNLDNTAPEAVSRAFLSALNDSDCDKAWKVTLNPKWEEKGKDWFCSSNAYGGVSKVTIYNIKELTNDNIEAVVFVDYYAEDRYNTNGHYKQNFILKKLENIGGFSWYIIGITNTN